VLAIIRAPLPNSHFWGGGFIANPPGWAGAGRGAGIGCGLGRRGSEVEGVREEPAKGWFKGDQDHRFFMRGTNGIFYLIGLGAPLVEELVIGYLEIDEGVSVFIHG